MCWTWARWPRVKGRRVGRRPRSRGPHPRGAAGLANRTDVPVSANRSARRSRRRQLDAGAVAIKDKGRRRSRAPGGRRPSRLRLRAHAHRGTAARPPRGSQSSGLPDRSRGPERSRGRALARGVAEDGSALDPGFDFDLGVRDDVENLFPPRRAGAAWGGRCWWRCRERTSSALCYSGSWGVRLPAGDFLWATAAATAPPLGAGAEILRLHDATALDAVRVAAAIPDPSASVSTVFLAA